MIDSSIIEEFDIEDYLNSVGVEYKTSGANVSKNNVAICCHRCDDSNFHCNIHLDTKFFNCWRCGGKRRGGSLLKLISELENISFSDAESIILNTTKHDPEHLNNFDYQIQKIFDSPLSNDKDKISKIILPVSMSLLNLRGSYKAMFLNYLYNRGFNDIDFLSDLGIKACIGGKYKSRLVIPIYFNNEIVTFYTRDVTNRSKIRYKNLSKENSIKSTKEVLYGFDLCKYNSTIILVEGVFDWLKVYLAIKNDNTLSVLCCSGKSLTISQKSLLNNLNPKEVIIFFDSGTGEDSIILAYELLILIDNISIINIDDGKDPGDLSINEINYFINKREFVR